LVDSGADLDAKDNDGQTPLHEAARRNQFDVTEVSKRALNLVRTLSLVSCQQRSIEEKERRRWRHSVRCDLRIYDMHSPRSC